MIRIGLFCAGGMSTSMLVKKMREAATKRGIEVEINAFAESAMEAKINDLDAVFLGPQVAYVIDKAKGIFAPVGVECEVINTMDYGMMNGDKILTRAIEIAKK